VAALIDGRRLLLCWVGQGDCSERRDVSRLQPDRDRFGSHQIITARHALIDAEDGHLPFDCMTDKTKSGHDL